MEFIQHIYYINLDYRTDRKKEIEEELDKIGIPEYKRTRISGEFKENNGALGCSLSHIKTIETFLESNHTTCIIFEDDFQFLVDEEQFQMSLTAFFHSNIEYDVVMLGSNLIKCEDTSYTFLKRILDAQTSSAYLLTKLYAPTLLNNIKESANFLEEFPVNNQYCLDIHWKTLQKKDRWFQLIPKVGIQRKSYSDIEKKITDYGV